MSTLDDEVLQMYLEESREHLAGIETDLLAMEEAGADIDEELVNKVFRAAHSLKGGAGFFGLITIKELSHKIENVLAMIRSRELVPNAEIINILLLAFDKLRELMNNPGESNDIDISNFIVSLTGLASVNLPPEKKESVRASVDINLPDGRTIMSVSQFDIDHLRQEGKNVYLVEYDLIHDVHRVGKKPTDLIRQIMEHGELVDSVVDVVSVGTLDDEPAKTVPFYVVCGVSDENALLEVPIAVQKVHLQLLFARTTEIAEAEIPSPAPKKPDKVAARPAPHSSLVSAASAGNTSKGIDRGGPATPTVPASKTTTPSVVGGQTETSLRVNVGVLENLMNLAGELVLSRNQLLESIGRNDQRALKISGQRISLVTSELQEAIMLTRMQPIGNVFNKFQRVVRDLSRDLGKQVRLDIIGSDVEMDKTIIEGLNDPLTHLVRNAVDHGIELPDDRAAAGKDRLGVITLRAYHEAGQVNVEICDDGKGLDSAKISASAVAKGLVTAEQVRTMSEKEMISLILLPGLSTAETVTDVSGRGVGMDVVKTNLDKLGGQIDISSEPGHGSTFRIKLPLTLAIIPCLLASINKERFAIPQVNVKELIRIPANQIKDRIELVGNAEVLILRGKLIPVIHLASILNIPPSTIEQDDGQQVIDRRRSIADRRSHSKPLFKNGNGSAGVHGRQEKPEDAERRVIEERRYHASSDLNIAIVTTGTLEYGLVVEELQDSVEIVVKPLGRHLKHLREYVGSTIMGNGRVALILDVAGLAHLSALTSLTGTVRATELAIEADRERFEENHSFLTFWGGSKEQCVVPLDVVARVEQIKTSDVEMVAGKRVMQYRGQVMPLFTLKDVADVSNLPENHDPIAVVFQVGNKEVGLLASAPVDALEAKLSIDQSTVRQTGIIGSTVVKGHTVLLVDIYEIVRNAYPDWVENRPKALTAEEKNNAILLAEDSDFFRQQVKRFIEEGGYRVIAGEDGLAAWKLLEEHEGEIKLVVTDIEMPRLDGYGLTKKIRGDKRFAQLPVMALTSLASEDDIAKGKAVGIDDYQIKLDRETLIEGIIDLLERGTQG
jgi:two-component system, chemotaxis family, sensor kinase CheA